MTSAGRSMPAVAAYRKLFTELGPVTRPFKRAGKDRPRGQDGNYMLWQCNTCCGTVEVLVGDQNASRMFSRHTCRRPAIPSGVLPMTIAPLRNAVQPLLQPVQPPTAPPMPGAPTPAKAAEEEAAAVKEMLPLR